MNRPSPPIYRTTNWPTCNEALKRRVSLTILFDPSMRWEGAPTGERGRRQNCIDAAIRNCLTMKVPFGMALRQGAEAPAARSAARLRLGRRGAQREPAGGERAARPCRPQATTGYAHLALQPVAAAAQRLGDHLAAALDGKPQTPPTPRAAADMHAPPAPPLKPRRKRLPPGPRIADADLRAFSCSTRSVGD
jgi:hypothetical protein